MVCVEASPPSINWSYALTSFRVLLCGNVLLLLHSHIVTSYFAARYTGQSGSTIAISRSLPRAKKLPKDTLIDKLVRSLIYWLWVLHELTIRRFMAILIFHPPCKLLHAVWSPWSCTTGPSDKIYRSLPQSKASQRWGRAKGKLGAFGPSLLGLTEPMWRWACVSIWMLMFQTVWTEHWNIYAQKAIKRRGATERKRPTIKSELFVIPFAPGYSMNYSYWLQATLILHSEILTVFVTHQSMSTRGSASTAR